MRVALIFDDRLRPETTGIHRRSALAAMAGTTLQFFSSSIRRTWPGFRGRNLTLDRQRSFAPFKRLHVTYGYRFEQYVAFRSQMWLYRRRRKTLDSKVEIGPDSKTGPALALGAARRQSCRTDSITFKMAKAREVGCPVKPF